MIFEHVGITVSNLDRSIGFYTNIFGFKMLRKTPSSAYLYKDNDILELMQSTESSTFEKPTTPDEWEQYMESTVGLIHLGIRVDDMEKAIQTIVEKGGKLVQPPIHFTPDIEYVNETHNEKLERASKPASKPYWPISMFADPDGVIIEILER